MLNRSVHVNGFRVNKTYKTLPNHVKTHINQLNRRARNHYINRINRKYPTQTKATFVDTIVHQSEIIGRGFILFVLFTSALNYFYYKDITSKIEESEAEQNTNDDQNKKDTK